MNDEHKIVQQVYAAKEDTRAADLLISTYLPFIKTETAKFLKRPPEEGRDDELSVAMLAFHEAISGYTRGRGGFLKYAALLIKSRLIDYARKEQRHNRIVSLDAPVGEDETPMGDTIADKYSLEDDVIDEILSEHLKCGLWPIVERYTGIQQYQVIRGYYKYGMTLRQIAEQLGISIEQARQFKEAGLRQLRQYKATKNLQENLEIVTGAVYRTGFVRFRQQGSTVENIAIRRYELDKISEVQKKTRLRKD